MIAVFIGLLSWMQLARLVRAQFVSLRERDFFRAARALGAGPWTLISRHLLPHTLSPIIVFATLRIGDMILLEAGLSYLGLSVDASTTPSWGNIIYDNKSAILTEWWIPFSAGFAIVLTVVGYNLLGDGLREAFDPRREQSGPERT
jgi:peptide/nickel transport system permease protein